MKKEYLIGAGLVGAAIGFVIGTNITLKKYKETINKDVKEAINKEVKNNVIQELEIKELRKEVKEEAINKVADKINDVTDKKLKDFDDRLKVMEDIDAKKLEVAKAAITAVVTISTVLIKTMNNKRNNVDEQAMLKAFAAADENFNTLNNRINVLEAK